MLAGYKTLIFNLALAIFGVLQSFNWVDVLGSTKAGYVVTGIGIIGMILRAVTTTPILSADPAPATK